MHLIALAIITLSFIAGVVETRESDPAGAGYALVIPVVVGHLIAIVPATIARRSSHPRDYARRLPLLYLLVSVLGIVPTLLFGGFIPRKGPPPEPTPPAMATVATGFANSINAQAPFVNVKVVDAGHRALLVTGRVPTQTEYARLKTRAILFANGWDNDRVLKQVRIGVVVADSAEQSGQPCRWNSTEKPVVIECLCGAKSSDSCGEPESPPNVSGLATDGLRPPLKP